MSRGKQKEGGSPAEKRRRMEAAEMGEEMWEEYSQADYDFMDVIASQSITQPPGLPHGTDTAPGHVLPAHTHSEPPAHTDIHPLPHTETLPLEPQFLAPLKPTGSFQRSRSSSSSQNGPTSDTSSSSLYPKSVGSNRSTLSITSLSSLSSSSSGRSSAAARCVTSDKLDRGTSILLPASPDMQTLQAEIETLRAALKSSKDEEYGKDGEIKMLRENLKQSKEERIESIQNLHAQKSEKEKSLKVENDKLSTQLQFTEREYQQLQDKYRHIEQRLHSVQTEPSGSRSPRPVGSRSPENSSPVSPKPVSSQRSPRVKSSFPTSRTFLGRESGDPPSVLTSALKDAETMTTFETCGTNRRRGVLSLDVKHSQGQVSGPQLVSKLIQSDRGFTKETDNESIMGLLQTPSTSLDLHSFMFERDSSTLLLSPVRSRRLADVKASLQQAERCELRRIVPQNLYILAVQGLQHLLTHPSEELPIDTTDSSSRQLSGSVLILPLLNCYLSHYIDLLSNSTTENVLTSPSSSTGSLRTCSSESPGSLESLTNSLSLLLMNGQRYANSLESYCLASLTTLCKLVSFSSAVRQFLLTGINRQSNSSPVKPVGKKTIGKDQGVSMETDQSSLSSGESSFSCGSSVSAEQLEEMNILHKVLRLANPGQGQETCMCNPHIVEEALNVFSSLASSTLESHCDRLKSVITQGLISNCLDCEVFPSIVLAAVKLLCRMCHSPAVTSSLCTSSDNCLLLTMYLLSVKSFEQADCIIKIAIYKQVVVCICNVVSSQGGALGILLDTDCQCSVEVIRSVIIMLCSVLDQYHMDCCDDTLSLLCRGLMLLHRISQHDGQFTDKHQDVQHWYVHLVCGLTSLLKNNTKLYDNELSALVDLWDFPQDDYELNQDSEEDCMETEATCS